MKIFQIIIDAMQQSSKKFNDEKDIFIPSSLIDSHVENDDLMI